MFPVVDTFNAASINNNKTMIRNNQLTTKYMADNFLWKCFKILYVIQGQTN